MIDLLVGKIEKVLDKDLYTVTVDIPGYQRNLKAFPKRGEVDEPREGDVVILTELDPEYKSFYLYEKLKENKFIGIRARGKVLQMNEEEITIGIFDPNDDSWFDDPKDNEGKKEPTSYIKVDKNGNIKISAEQNTNVDIQGKCDITISGETTINANGKLTVNAQSDTTINAKSNLTITGGGNVKMAGSATPSTTPGPFNCIPTCPFSGAPHAATQIGGV
jgi:hypothetical protein